MYVEPNYKFYINFYWLRLVCAPLFYNFVYSYSFQISLKYLTMSNNTQNFLPMEKNASKCKIKNVYITICCKSLYFTSRKFIQISRKRSIRIRIRKTKNWFRDLSVPNLSMPRIFLFSHDKWYRLYII